MSALRNAAVEAHLIAEIAAKGPIGVARFMDIALSLPGHGYYQAREAIGAGADFVTAPEISQMFGEMIGLWLVAVWEGMGAPAPFDLVELGPGRGTLLVDALRAAQIRPGFGQAARLHCVESSPRLQRVQAECLAAQGLSATWHPTLAALDGAHPILFLANEFFDALPAEQFVAGPDGWHQRRVAHDGERFHFVEGPPAALAPEIAQALSQAETGALFEQSPVAVACASQMAHMIMRRGGAGLIIDYGHWGPSAGDSFQAVHGHRYADPLGAPGAADLTFHVDFAALAGAATRAGAVVAGPVRQGAFLLALGLLERTAHLARGKSEREQIELARQCARLTQPEEMGSLFKAMALSHPSLGPLPGLI